MVETDHRGVWETLKDQKNMLGFKAILEKTEQLLPEWEATNLNSISNMMNVIALKERGQLIPTSLRAAFSVRVRAIYSS